MSYATSIDVEQALVRFTGHFASGSGAGTGVSNFGLFRNPSSQRRLGPSPIQVFENTKGWIPAFAGMTNAEEIGTLFEH